MELKYTYKKGAKYLVGWLLDYPEHPTQGIDIPDLEKHHFPYSICLSFSMVL
jgi:hypothetical protein